ncbi:hypothetical protein L9F63_025555 [Diploptera punctata]|uniref:WAPL domain-containing protein n=1 Tax=Diploptera punctata TaxID=6984 RepID=A0AAD8E4Q6_DIPPU|nr:hypothetical protein L9F63_025555 [Diploptera punctata]
MLVVDNFVIVPRDDILLSTENGTSFTAPFMPPTPSKVTNVSAGTRKHRYSDARVSGRDEIFGNKKPKLDYSNRSSQNATSKDPFSFEADTADKVVSAPKPKKFFKSRNIDMNLTYGSHGGKKYGKGSYSSRTQQCNTSSSSQNNTGVSKKFFTGSAIKNSGYLKGTSHLVNEIKEPSSVQQPPKSSENSITVRCTRRRHGDLGGESWTVTTHESNKEKSYASITSPKKSNKTNKEAVRNNNTSELMTGEKTVESQNLTNNEHENIISEGIISEVDMSSIQYPTLQKTKSATPVPEIPTSLPEELESLAVAPVATDLTNSGDLDKEDQEKLLKAEELLSSTYVDFSTATEKLLMSGPKETSKTIVDQDWENVRQSVRQRVIESMILRVWLESEQNSGNGHMGNGTNERTCSPATKKGSIFKSRSLLSDASKKRLALYKHKWADDKDGTGGGSQTETAASSASKHSSQPSGANTDVDDDAEAITSIKCNRKVKAPCLECQNSLVFYLAITVNNINSSLVVRNVKKAHQIQESGEFQEFNDDVEFFLDALQDNNPIGTRCLSAITLASKCMLLPSGCMLELMEL